MSEIKQRKLYNLNDKSKYIWFTSELSFQEHILQVEHPMLIQYVLVLLTYPVFERLLKKTPNTLRSQSCQHLYLYPASQQKKSIQI